MHTYCHSVSKIKDAHDVDRLYHDNHYGVRIEDDNELFGRLLMEINQAGLSWRTILLKEEGFRKAYDGFDVEKIASYTDSDKLRLLQDASIIRNRLKIDAAIYNAQVIADIQKENESFRRWLDCHAEVIGVDKGAWVKLFKKYFKFTGGEIVGEFLMSINMLPGAHGRECGRYKNMIG